MIDILRAVIIVITASILTTADAVQYEQYKAKSTLSTIHQI